MRQEFVGVVLERCIWRDCHRLVLLAAMLVEQLFSDLFSRQPSLLLRRSDDVAFPEVVVDPDMPKRRVSSAVDAQSAPQMDDIRLFVRRFRQMTISR